MMAEPGISSELGESSVRRHHPCSCTEAVQKVTLAPLKELWVSQQLCRQLLLVGILGFSQSLGPTVGTPSSWWIVATPVELPPQPPYFGCLLIGCLRLVGQWLGVNQPAKCFKGSSCIGLNSCLNKQSRTTMAIAPINSPPVGRRILPYLAATLPVGTFGVRLPSLWLDTP